MRALFHIPRWVRDKDTLRVSVTYLLPTNWSVSCFCRVSWWRVIISSPHFPPSYFRPQKSTAKAEKATWLDTRIQRLCFRVSGLQCTVLSVNFSKLPLGQLKLRLVLSNEEGSTAKCNFTTKRVVRDLSTFDWYYHWATYCVRWSTCQAVSLFLGVKCIFYFFLSFSFLFFHSLTLSLSTFFSFRCLIKDYEQRPMVCQLLCHPFIKQVNYYSDEVKTTPPLSFSL